MGSLLVKKIILSTGAYLDGWGQSIRPKDRAWASVPYVQHIIEKFCIPHSDEMVESAVLSSYPTAPLQCCSCPWRHFTALLESISCLVCRKKYSTVYIILFWLQHTVDDVHYHATPCTMYNRQTLITLDTIYFWVICSCEYNVSYFINLSICLWILIDAYGLISMCMHFEDSK